MNTYYVNKKPSGRRIRGEDYNANIQVKLYTGRKYVLRLRLYYQYRAGDVGVMMW